jgi:hypothetical protein
MFDIPTDVQAKMLELVEMIAGRQSSKSLHAIDEPALLEAYRAKARAICVQLYPPKVQASVHSGSSVSSRASNCAINRINS